MDFKEMKHLTILASLAVDRAEDQPIKIHLIQHAEILYGLLAQVFEQNHFSPLTYLNFRNIYAKSLNTAPVGRGLQGVMELLWPIMLSRRYGVTIEQFLEETTASDVYQLTKARNYAFQKSGRAYRAPICRCCDDISTYERTHTDWYPKNHTIFHEQFTNGLAFLHGQPSIRRQNLYNTLLLDQIYQGTKQQYPNTPTGIVGDFTIVTVLDEYLRREKA